MTAFAADFDPQVEVDLRFTYHAPSEDQIPKYSRIRNEAREFALVLFEECPNTPELVRAVDKLDEVVMLANAAIARHAAMPKTPAD